MTNPEHSYGFNQVQEFLKNNAGVALPGDFGNLRFGDQLTESITKFKRALYSGKNGLEGALCIVGISAFPKNLPVVDISTIFNDGRDNPHFLALRYRSGFGGFMLRYIAISGDHRTFPKPIEQTSGVGKVNNPIYDYYDSVYQYPDPDSQVDQSQHPPHPGTFTLGMRTVTQDEYVLTLRTLRQPLSEIDVPPPPFANPDDWGEFRPQGLGIQLNAYISGLEIKSTDNYYDGLLTVELPFMDMAIKLPRSLYPNAA